MSVTVILTYLSLGMVKSVPGIERQTEKERYKGQRHTHRGRVR